MYEISNHLGNVLTTVSDIKLTADGNADGVVDSYAAVIISAQDYYPFGSLEPGRTYSSESYRFGFNGKENDNEVKGTGNQQDYGMRIYDPRLGRFLSVDPLAMSNVSISTYCFADNSPIYKIDKNGSDGVIILDEEHKTLTIKAVYYVATEQISSGGINVPMYNSSSIATLNSSIDSYLNSQNYQVTEGYYSGYSVKFDFEFKDGGNSIEASEKVKSNPDMINGFPISNTFEKRNSTTCPQFKPRTMPDGSTRIIGGVTDLYKYITMNQLCDNKRNRIHEIFHTLFFNRDANPDGIGSYTVDDMPNQEDINILINSRDLPKTRMGEDTIEEQPDLDVPVFTNGG